MNKENKIKCPNCNTLIDVNELLYHQVYENIQNEFNKKLNLREDEFKQKQIKIQNQEIQLIKEKENLETILQNKLQEKLIIEKQNIEKSIQDRIQNENKEFIKSLQEQLNLQSQQIQQLNKTRAELEIVKREKDQLADKINFEKEKEFSEKIKQEKMKIKQQIDEENFLKIKEREKIIDDLKTQLDQAKRKADQWSWQLQWEIQELELEKLLKSIYIFDEICEVKKWQRWADVLQIVKTNFWEQCWKIYYESKRTKSFDTNWIQKLRDDNLNVKADILIIVSESLPDWQDGYFLKDWVWICSFTQVKWLSYVLRYWLIELYQYSLTQQWKDSKMEILYKYLTSLEFKWQFEAIIQWFKSLQDSYHDEKLRMEKIWKEREKQLEKILLNAVKFYWSLKWIAGSSIPNIWMLEDWDISNKNDNSKLF